MRVISFVVALSALISAGQTQSPQAPSVPLGTDRPATPGITRTTLRDDAKSAITRVRFAPDALETPHTHPYDIIIVPVTTATVDFRMGDQRVTRFEPGQIQFVPRETVHSLANKGDGPFELIVVGVK